MKRIDLVQVLIILFSVLYNAKASDKLYTTKSGLLCMKCIPGFHLVADCHINMTTSACRPCNPGYYKEEHNNDMNCLPCSQSCRNDMERVSNCSSTSNINCTCKFGFYLDKDHDQCRENKSDVPGLQSNDERAMKKVNDSRTPDKGSEIHSFVTIVISIMLGLQILILLILMRQLPLHNWMKLLINFFKCRSSRDAKNKQSDNAQQKGDAERKLLLDEIMPQLLDEIMPKLLDEIMPKLLDEIMSQIIHRIKKEYSESGIFKEMQDHHMRVDDRLKTQFLDNALSDWNEPIEISTISNHDLGGLPNPELDTVSVMTSHGKGRHKTYP